MNLAVNLETQDLWVVDEPLLERGLMLTPSRRPDYKFINYAIA